jgi:phage-related protein
LPTLWLGSIKASPRSMPLSRPMPSIGSGVHELGLKDRSGQYRVIYALVRGANVHVLHAFRKTTQTTPPQRIEIPRRRLREVRND